MSNKEKLYGLRVGLVHDVATALAIRLNCTFEARESDYLGEYCLARTGHGELKIVAQPDPEGDPFEDEFEGYQVLIYSTVEHDGFELDGSSVGRGIVERLR